MTESINTPDNDKKDFWSPIEVFLLGTPVAVLNWWRMGNKQKGVIFICLTICVTLFVNWIKPTQLYWQYYGKNVVYSLYGARVLIGIVYSWIVMKINMHDIQGFNKSEKPVNKVGPEFILISWLAMSIVLVGIGLTAGYIGKFTNYCHFPRLLDVVYGYEVTQRTGLDTIYLSQRDFSCDIVWYVESYEKITKSNREEDYISYSLYGSYDQDKSFTLRQKVYLYNEPIEKDDFDEMTSWINNSDPPSLFIQFPENQIKLEFTKFHCHQNDEFKHCSIYMANGNILVYLDVLGDNDSGFDKYIISPFISISERILQFEN